MAATLTHSARRRIINWGLLIAAVSVFWNIQRTQTQSLKNTAILTGAVLLATCIALALFNARKKLPFIPLLRASVWTQFHVYAGWFSVVVFFYHTGFRAPDGNFEIALYVVFLVVAVSGVLGLAISRIYPARLRLHGENLIYERIPALRIQLQKDAEQIIWKSINETKSFTLAKFYEGRLKTYFSSQKNTVAHLIGSHAPLNKLTEDIKQLERYMVVAERAFLYELLDCINAKCNLDQQRACQGLLKYWLFVHIPLTFSLLLMGAVHGLLALAFS